MNIRFIRSAEKKKIVEKLNEQFGIESVPHLLIESGKEKLRGFSGHLSKEEISEISQILRIETVGLYMFRQELDFRLSMDATVILKDQITKNVIEVNEEQFQSWLRGHDLQIQCPRGVVVIKYQDDFIGCGKSNGETIFNYVPKDRRLKK